MQRQCNFRLMSEPKTLMVRTTDEKRDLLKIVAAHRRKSVNKLINDLIDTVLKEEGLGKPLTKQKRLER